MRFASSFALTACLGLWACGESTVAIPAFLVADTPPGPSTPCPVIGFDDVGPPGARVSTHTSCGFTVTATTPNWAAWTGYGHPPPFIGFMSAEGTTTTGELRVTAAAGKFRFQSVDVYSSTTPIPYLIQGVANGQTVFSLQSTQPNTYGEFATVSNPDASAEIDALVIQLVNPAAPCCPNPTGLDTIVVQ
jgi:hypothetical protein